MSLSAGLTPPDLANPAQRARSRSSDSLWSGLRDQQHTSQLSFSSGSLSSSPPRSTSPTGVHRQADLARRSQQRRRQQKHGTRQVRTLAPPTFLQLRSTSLEPPPARSAHHYTGLTGVRREAEKLDVLAAQMLNIWRVALATVRSGCSTPGCCTLGQRD